MILGPNGAGKTTLLKALAGVIGRQGVVTLSGEPLPAGDASGAVRRGLALVAVGLASELARSDVVRQAYMGQA